MKINWDKTIQFLKGYAFAIITTSTIALAVSTNIAGFNIFTSGTPISSTAVNDNFGKLAGIEVFKATNTAGLVLNDVTTLSTSRCNASIEDCHFGAMTLTSTISNGTYVTEAATADTNSGTVSISGGGNYTLITIATSGWYDFYLKKTISSMQVTWSGTAWDRSYLDIETFINKIESAVTSPNIQNENFGDSVVGKIRVRRAKEDNDGSTSITPIEDITKVEPGFQKRLYLTAGDKFYLGYSFKRDLVTSGDNITVPAGNLEFKIVYLP
ncbi:MAG: hypothetical protein COW01_02050 [Bdellovibrionales bacterium CG12_big_fil_rev_8_21_14_0_65_38_15]|nr:MAG: hypothetical protein COW79_02285 [Bdellovibrionales bacterium CG22_combo_CG10-13_8_21_14_all_38_13]PIQ57088.1 MAG: hypothetical protein COW01_02050 [Bdellovibrionales bacterium CG12_big_fil_rev_8_21_14_0_65_38_15]PIR30118.1 MAG: hypothetical protein COV38_07445 [Bdellovibrionales bacterium CG11_big_fil_rev_8_21_14_0_20_38_13]